MEPALQKAAVVAGAAWPPEVQHGDEVAAARHVRHYGVS